MDANALLDNLNHLCVRMAETRTAEEILSALVEGARGLLPFTACALALTTEHGWEIYRVSASRPSKVSRNGLIPQAAADTLQRFLVHGQPLRIDDLLAPPWSATSHREILWKDGTRSALLLPLVAGGAPRGTLSFTSAHPDQYPQVKHDITTLLSWMVAHALVALPPTVAARAGTEAESE